MEEADYGISKITYLFTVIGMLYRSLRVAFRFCSHRSGSRREGRKGAKRFLRLKVDDVDDIDQCKRYKIHPKNELENARKTREFRD